MPIKKTELYSSLWKSCDELRGGMDASQYKDYVLVLLFVKYVSDRYAGQKDALFVVPKGGGFADMVALGGDKEIGDKINKIISKLAAANDLRGVIDVADFNDQDKLGKGKEMVERLSNLVAIFNKPGLDFRGNRAEGDDILGDAYEYLMRHFATESGKSKGQFYTPAEVSRVMAKVVGCAGAKDSSQTIHDPTCGSGSLLLKAHDEAKASTGLDLALYGQEMDNATHALARMNMILHGCDTAEIWKDNTLASPHFKAANGGLKTFDFVVANPPFSAKAWSNGLSPSEDEHGRFALGVPPAKNGDYAFLLHVLSVLKTTGKGAVIVPHGVLFRGGAEAQIRKNLITRGYVKGIIGLPPNLFYGTGIPACIVVLDKEHAAARKGIFMIDASRGFAKDGNKNRLRERDIHLIVDTFTRLAEVPGYARLVPRSEIEEHGYNLNLPRYIDASEPEDQHDIAAHLHGGIPSRDVDLLKRWWDVLPGVRAALFSPGDRPATLRLNVPPKEVNAAITEHPEVMDVAKKAKARFAKWRKAHAKLLWDAGQGASPKRILHVLSEALLDAFHEAPLIDPYDVYQLFMDHWAETVQDDLYLIAEVGWEEAARPQPLPEKSKERPDYVDGKAKMKSGLIPASLIAARFFRVEQKGIDALIADRDAARGALDELEEEHGGDDGLLSTSIQIRKNRKRTGLRAWGVVASRDGVT